jgi:uncharacterized protein YyaL (SSP411 family)
VSEAKANRLAKETSPYLLQHAHNPVDWYPWGDEALAKARREDKPILLSVGYSACHWCHVMERECFENEAIARLMNEHFVCIKVDREERPDIDHVYMEAVQAMTGGGGWPMTVFLTPDGEPFYGGTYFPPEDRHGLPAFPRVLEAVGEAYRSRRSQLAGVARDLVSRLRRVPSADSEAQPLSADILADAFRALEASFDDGDGGFGPGPKFPQAPVLEFLLQYHRRTREARALRMVELTLDKMAAGGIYDHIGGGFHRYATDARWMIPHFEKMLYDNALLGRLYLHAYQVMGKAGYRRIAEETLDYVLREMTAPNGGFYSSQDADVEGEEGRYYLWTPGEINELLGEEDGRLINRYFGVGDSGDSEIGSILHVARDPAGLVAEAGVHPAEIETVVARSRALLLEARGGRPSPPRDDKILASWNGLMLQALAEASGVLERRDYLKAAVANASFVVGNLMKDEALMHSYKDGVPRIPGYLEDYAFVIRGLLSLHEATLEQRWLETAVWMTDAMVKRFGGEKSAGVFYDTGPDQSTLFIRPRDTSDSVKPCGGSAAAEVLIRISRIIVNDSSEKLAAAMLGLVGDQMVAHPLASGNWLCSLDLHLSDPEEMVVVGRRDDPDTGALLMAIHSQYRPNKVIVGLQPGDAVFPVLDELFRDREMTDSRPTVYLCRGRVCLPPATDLGQLRRLLQG